MDTLAKTRQRLVRHRKLLHVLGFLFGLFVSFFVIFQVFFLAKVLPHGGI